MLTIFFKSDRDLLTISLLFLAPSFDLAALLDDIVYGVPRPSLEYSVISVN